MVRASRQRADRKGTNMGTHTVKAFDILANGAVQQPIDLLLGTLATQDASSVTVGALTEGAEGSLTATGSNQATALVLDPTKMLHEVTTAAASTGVKLPTAIAGQSHFVANAGANSLTVYPTGAETINGGASFAIGNGKSAWFTCCTTGAFRAQLGA